MTGLRHRGRWALFAVVATLAGLILGVTSPGGATVSNALTGSTFESGDGNLIINDTTTPGVDWATDSTTTASPAPNFVAGTDLSRSTLDNAFGQGAKEDIPCPTAVQGSIPPNKSDLTRFYSSWELANGHYYLYLAWERSNVLGNANMDFEFQQDGSLCPNNVTDTRTAGDRLVTFDFPGSGTPALGLLTWATDASTPSVSGFSSNVCYSANKFPCWSDFKNLSTANVANGAVNSEAVTDPLANSDTDNPPTYTAVGSLPAGTFGEAGIDLTAAGVLTPGGACTFFGSAQLNSRSSSSFTSEIKDFVGPVPVNITNCGSVLIKKTFSSTAPGANDPATFGAFVDNLNSATPPAYGTYESGGDPLYTYPNTTTVGTGGISDSATALPVADATKFKESSGSYSFPFYVQVESEVLKVTAASDTSLTVVRGRNGSSAAAHTAGKTVTKLALCEATDFNNTDKAYECTINDLPFGHYVIRETHVPASYQGAGNSFVNLTSESPTATVTATNTANPTDLVIHKRDDSNSDPTKANPVKLCAISDTTSTDCAKFQLFASSATSTVSGAISATGSVTKITVADGTNFAAGYVVVNKEAFHVTGVSGNDLTIDARAQLGSVAAAHSDGAAIDELVKAKDCAEVGTQTLAGGDCTFQQVDPGTYWIGEVMKPAGYAPSSEMVKKVTVTLGQTSPTEYTIINTRLFKVITFVCSEWNDQFAGESVTFDGSTKTSRAHSDSAITGIDESAICKLSSGATFSDKTASTTAYTGSVTIS